MASFNQSAGGAAGDSPRLSRLLSVKQAAEYTIVSQSTIRRWLKDGLPFFRVRKQIRIDQQDLVKFLRAGGSNGNCENP
jgi:excisionase family DNA binding protein